MFDVPIVTVIVSNDIRMARHEFRQAETSAKPPIDRSGVSAERRKLQEIQEGGFLPKTATPLLQRFRFVKIGRNTWAAGRLTTELRTNGPLTTCY
jgi:hypothetical protein